MKITKGTKCILSKFGHYNIVYMSDQISLFNKDCDVDVKPYINNENKSFIAVQTLYKNIGQYETESDDNRQIVVWIEK